MTDVFDAERALEELTSGLHLSQNQARLSFRERCGAFCALYQKTPHSIVARAFGITKATASMLAGCLPDGLDHKVKTLGFESQKVRVEFQDPDNPRRVGSKEVTTSVPTDVVVDYDPNQHRDPHRRARYRDVADEFLRLGRDEFFRTYYTDDIHVRLMEAKYQPGAEGLGREQLIADRAKAKYSFNLHQAIACNDTYYRIDWVPKGRLEFEGWHYSPCNEDGTPLEGGEYDWVYFIEGEEARAFRTSAEAYDALFALNGLESPRPKSGRPKYRR